MQNAKFYIHFHIFYFRAFLQVLSKNQFGILFNFVLDDPTYCFLQILYVSKNTAHSLLQWKWKFILNNFPVVALLNSFPGSKILQMSQFLLPQIKTASS